MSNALEQFIVICSTYTIYPFFFQLLLNTSSIYFITFFFFIICYTNFYKSIKLIPRQLDFLHLVSFGIVRTAFNENVHNSLTKFYISIFYMYFLLVLTYNLIGTVPYSFAMTSHITITFALSFIIFFSTNFITISVYKFEFFTFFLPNNIPFVISTFLVLIELISYIAKLFSLSIRLFANIVAGHILLKIIATFNWIVISAIGFDVLCLFLITTVLLFVLFLLEYSIGILQSYVFVTLNTIYLQNTYLGH